MQELGKVERFAIEAVARHFSASWQPGADHADAWLTLAGRPIAIDIAVIPSPPAARSAEKPRSRDDKVARRVLRDLEEELRPHVPSGQTVVLTLGAPIKEPNKLVAALAEMLLRYLHGGAHETEEKKTILANRVRFRVLEGDPRWNVNVVGFVFSGDPQPGALVNALRLFYDEIAARAKKHRPGRSEGGRWLVLASSRWIADIKTYRQAWSRLPAPAGFEKILMVLESGRIEPLAGDS